jgi:hypothetical protein
MVSAGRDEDEVVGSSSGYRWEDGKTKCQRSLGSKQVQQWAMARD